MRLRLATVGGFFFFKVLFKFCDLFTDELTLRLLRCRKEFERGEWNEDHVPFVGCHTTQKHRAIPFREIVGGGDQQIRARVGYLHGSLPVNQRVIRNDEHRLAGKAKSFGFHRRHDRGERLAHAHFMTDQGCLFLNDAPGSIPLVRAQLDDVCKTRCGKVRSVITNNAHTVELFVVQLGQSLRPVRVIPQPLLELGLDFSEFCLCCDSFSLVERAVFAITIVHNHLAGI